MNVKMLFLQAVKTQLVLFPYGEEKINPRWRHHRPAAPAL